MFVRRSSMTHRGVRRGLGPDAAPGRPRPSVLSLRILMVTGALAWLAVLVAPGQAGAAARSFIAGAADTAESAMTWWKAAILGTVEGLTEYVPVSSTGHLLVVSDLLGLGDTEADRAAANTYAIAIQFGAIIAVAGLFWRRFVAMVQGLFGRSEEGRHLLVITVIAFVPAAVVGFLFDDAIEERLFGPWPIVAAWFVGGVAILLLERANLIPHGGSDAASLGEEDPARGRDPLLAITNRQALLIGLAQVLALWPGTSRSLATILGALLVGVGMRAAVEFSFVLGFVTLSAATFYSLASDGGGLFEQFGVIDPLIGLVFAFLSAVVAIRWMISYLERNSLAIFGWYRIVVALLAAGLAVVGTI
ncbi:MAG: undecaprenyl-diphosphate phosphatase [Microthrixaceae bacterium]|nr:undecaprenyl-diphosphate phosphatase [Microthrixaceae bacterium]